jgi:hypothetical protein
LWANPALLVADAARHYPDGVNAQLGRAARAAQMGDHAAATEALRAALARGYDRFDHLLANPSYSPLHGDPAFDAVIADMAGRWITRLGVLQAPSQSELLSLAIAHRLRGEREEARRAALRGLSQEGPLREQLEREIRLLGEG